MSILAEDPQNRYHAYGKASEEYLRDTPIEQLRKWAADPNCIEREKVAVFLIQEEEREQRSRELRSERLLKRCRDQEANPCDRRTEVSADARHIVKNIWIIFVILPICLYVLFLVFAALIAVARH